VFAATLDQLKRSSRDMVSSIAKILSLAPVNELKGSSCLDEIDEQQFIPLLYFSGQVTAEGHNQKVVHHFPQHLDESAFVQVLCIDNNTRTHSTVLYQ
jgi:hypothetical protein